MKKIYINKCGYSIGVYGCSNEYFNCIVITGDKVIGFTFSGLYGADSRVKEAFKKLGYDDGYLPLNTYGKLTKKEATNAHSEHTIISNLDELLNKGYLELNKNYRAKAGLKALNK